MKNIKSIEGIIKKMDIYGLLFIILLILKLTNIIDWNWWWVSSPLWIPLIIFLIIFTLFNKKPKNE